MPQLINRHSNKVIRSLINLSIYRMIILAFQDSNSSKQDKQTKFKVFPQSNPKASQFRRK